MTLLSLVPRPLQSWLRHRFPERYAKLRERYVAYCYWRHDLFAQHRWLAFIVGAPLLAWNIVTFPLRSLLFMAALLPSRPVRTDAVDGQRRVILMLVISELARDPRVQRSARRLSEAGFRVKLVYPDLNGERIDWGPGIEFLPLPELYGAYPYRFPYLFGVKYLWSAAWSAARSGTFAIHAHDLNTALVGLAAARVARAYCVCDFHEWYSENTSWSGSAGQYVSHPSYTRLVYRLAERLALRRATAVVTVCESIASELESLSPVPRQVHVVRNIPSAAETNSAVPRGLRAALGLDQRTLLILYQGGTGPSRLIEPLIEALRLAPGAALAIRGPGIEKHGPGYEKLARRHGIAERVFCLPPVPAADVVAAARDASAGIWTLPNLCKNFYYALPNKIFEYLAAGLPILAADYPEVRRIVERYRVGLLFDPYDPASIAAGIRRLIDEPGLLDELRANIPAALEDMRPDREWEKLAHIYRSLAAGVQPAAR